MTTQTRRIESENEIYDRKNLELKLLVERFTGSDGAFSTAVSNLRLYRSSTVGASHFDIATPAFCVIAQGIKHVALANETYAYDPTNYLLVSVDLPLSPHIVKASNNEPYLGLGIELDPAQIGELILENKMDFSRKNPIIERGLMVSRLKIELLDAVIRLLRLLETPEEIPVMSPLILCEITFRLLHSEQSARLRQIASANSRTHRIARVINLLKRNYTQTLRIETLAREANMSPSALHQEFKNLTAMSPLQYQKQLRLQEARRLLLSESIDAATAAFQVGYESPSQFSREYSRLYGNPPLRDISQFRSVNK